ncbi:MAG: hypothetical protein PVF57_14260 [Pseudomonadales bacterium]|jgi:hypothetical protein
MSQTLTAKWLKQAQDSVNSDPAFRKLGNIDTKIALKVGKPAYLIDFSGFTCHGVHKISESELRDADYLIEMTPETWGSFLAGRREGDGPSLAELDTTEGVVKAKNPRDKLDFYRYHLSVQAFLDAGAQHA